MTESPERIWAARGLYTARKDNRWPEPVEYIRADLVDPAAIREAALREAAGVAHKGVEAFGAKMRAAPNKQEKRDWQSMLMGAVDIEHAIIALIEKEE